MAGTARPECPRAITRWASDLFFFELQADNPRTAILTHARIPVALVKPTDEPEIPEPDHQSLVDFSTGFLRIREGGQELANEAPALQSFLTAVKKRAAQVRARSLAQRHGADPPSHGLIVKDGKHDRIRKILGNGGSI